MDETKKVKEISLNNKLVDELIQKKNYLYTEDIVRDVKNEKLVEIIQEINSVLCFPIFLKRNLEGILFFGQKKNDTIFHKEDLEVLEETVMHASRQLESIANYKFLSERHAAEVLANYKSKYQLELINEIKNLGRINDINKLCTHAQKVINRLLNGSDTSIYLYDEKKSVTSIKAIFQNSTESQWRFLKMNTL